MSSEGLRTEVSTDILLYENKEMGGSGVVFVVCPWFVHFPIRRTFRNSARRSASRCPFCTRFVKCCRSRVLNSTDRTWQLILSSISKTKEEISTLEELIQKKVGMDELADE